METKETILEKRSHRQRASLFTILDIMFNSFRFPIPRLTENDKLLVLRVILG